MDSFGAFDVCNHPVTLTFRVYFEITLFISTMKVKCNIRGYSVACSDKTERRVTLLSAQADITYESAISKTPSYGRNNNNEVSETGKDYEIDRIES